MSSSTDRSSHHAHEHEHARATSSSSSSSMTATGARKAAPQSERSRWWHDVMSIDTPPKKSAVGQSKSASTSTATSGTVGVLAKPRTGRQFPCPTCPSKVFERRGHLDAHIETVHEGKRPHSCPRGCGKVFGHRSSLQRHVKTVHENPDHPDYHKTRSKNYPTAENVNVPLAFPPPQPQ